MEEALEEDKTDLEKVRNKHYSNFGVCPQFDIFWPGLTIREHLRIFSMLNSTIEFNKNGQQDSEINKIKEMNKLRAYQNSLVDILELSHNLDTEAHKLSGGSKRRLSLLLSLLRKPRILFLDEPSTSLDPKKRAHFWNFLKKVKKDTTILLTTHLMNEVDGIVDRIGFLVKGELREQGKVYKLKQKYIKVIKIEIILKTIKTKDLSEKELMKLAEVMEENNIEEKIGITDLCMQLIVS